MEVAYDKGRKPSVSLELTPEQAVDLYNYLHKYDTSDGYLTRSVVAQKIYDSGVVEDLRYQ